MPVLLLVVGSIVCFLACAALDGDPFNYSFWLLLAVGGLMQFFAIAIMAVGAFRSKRTFPPRKGAHKLRSAAPEDGARPLHQRLE